MQRYLGGPPPTAGNGDVFRHEHSMAARGESTWPAELEWVITELEQTIAPNLDRRSPNKLIRAGMVMSGAVQLERDDIDVLETLAAREGWRYWCGNRCVSFASLPRSGTARDLRHFTTSQDEMASIELELRVHR
jgi:hypothetical protein